MLLRLYFDLLWSRNTSSTRSSCYGSGHEAAKTPRTHSVCWQGDLIVFISDDTPRLFPGLEDFAHGRNYTIGALLSAIASIRLTKAGLNIPKVPLAAEPELALYNYLERDHDDAYPYYNALLNSLNSFCNALELKSGHF